MTNCKSGVFPVSITDHYPVFISISNVLLDINDKVECKFRCHNKNNLLNLESKLSEQLSSFSDYDNLSIEDRCNLFVNIFNDAYNSCCPIKTKYMSVKRINSPWLSVSLLRCISRKHWLYRQSLMDADYVDQYKRYRNVLTTTIRNAKKAYFDDKFNSCIRDSRKTWRAIGDILSPNTKRGTPLEMESNDDMIADPLIIATKFNEHYVSVAEKLASKIPPSNVNPLNNITPRLNSFVYMPCDSNEIMNTIASFKSKGAPLDFVPSYIFKHVASTVSPVISSLINSSFFEGVFPINLKIARVIPIFKSGSRSSFSNYRPISTLSFLSKIFERIMFSRLDSYFHKYDILCSEQFGFRRDHSTSDAVLRYTDSVYSALNSGEFHMSVMLDLSKAFDTVQHSILLGKLELYGIRGLSLSWVQSYLTDRKQYVSIDGTDSQLLPITAGVPQGSILGPLLFLIYINDMHLCSNIVSFVHFADDTTMFYKSSELDDLYETVNAELECVDSWLRANKLSLNVEKSVCMIHSNRNANTNQSIKIRDIEIKSVDETKFLGIIIDNKLSFASHINYVCSRLSRSCGIIRKLSFYLPLHVLKKIYLSLALPHLTYGVEIWGGTALTGLSKLGGLQDRCVKRLSYAVQSDISTIYQCNNLLPLSAIHKYFVSIKFYQYFILARSHYFYDIFNKIQIQHSIPTRFKTSHCLNFPAVYKSKVFKSFVYKSVKIWNDIPVDIKQCKSLYIFKRKARIFYSS